MMLKCILGCHTKMVNLIVMLKSRRNCHIKIGNYHTRKNT